MADEQIEGLCVFCGSRANSKEHVYAKRLCLRAGVPLTYTVLVGLATEGKENVFRKGHPIDSFQVREVCRECNHGWMNDLEGWFESRLGFLIEPNWPQLALTMIEELKSERHKLAQWLTKTAVMYSLAGMQGKHRVDFSASVTRNVKAGTLPENCWVDLAYSKSVATRLGGGITRCFRVINGDRRARVQSQVLQNGDGFKFIIQYNHLLLSIGQAPNANVQYLSYKREMPVRMYPTARQIPDNFAYNDIMYFERSLRLRTWAGCPGNIQ